MILRIAIYIAIAVVIIRMSIAMKVRNEAILRETVNTKVYMFIEPGNPPLVRYVRAFSVVEAQ